MNAQCTQELHRREADIGAVAAKWRFVRTPAVDAPLANVSFGEGFSMRAGVCGCGLVLGRSALEILPRWKPRGWAVSMGIVCRRPARRFFLRAGRHLAGRHSEVPSRVLRLSEQPMSPVSLPDWIEFSTRRIPTGPVQLVAAGLSALMLSGDRSCGLLPR